MKEIHVEETNNETCQVQEINMEDTNNTCQGKETNVKESENET